MRIVKKWMGKTGKEWLAQVSDEDSITEVEGEVMCLIPVTLPFSNQAELAREDLATHVSVSKARFNNAVMVTI